jgi:hypothetical protein
MQNWHVLLFLDNATCHPHVEEEERGRRKRKMTYYEASHT